MDRERIRVILEKNDIPFGEDLPGKLEIYLRLLLEWNRRMDLIAEAGEEEILDRHFTDSLTVLRTELIPERSRIIDVGTGAGFPGMVLAMARGDLEVTLLDAQQKRLNFLEAVGRETGMTNITLMHGRAEDAARDRKHREQYDVALARAVAPLNVLGEYLLPFVRIGGCALCWKGPALKEEQEEKKETATPAAEEKESKSAVGFFF